MIGLMVLLGVVILALGITSIALFYSIEGKIERAPVAVLSFILLAVAVIAFIFLFDVYLDRTAIAGSQDAIAVDCLQKATGISTWNRTMEMEDGSIPDWPRLS